MNPYDMYKAALGSQAASYGYLAEKEPPMTRDQSTKDLAIAGANAIYLASTVLSHLDDEEGVDTRILCQAARNVLKDWGAELQTWRIAKPPAADASIPDFESPIEEKQQEQEPTVITWPPTHYNRTELPRVYKENFYYLRESTLDGWYAENPLVLLDSYYSKEHAHWRLLLRNDLVSLYGRWFSVDDVRVGAEIAVRKSE